MDVPEDSSELEAVMVVVMATGDCCLEYFLFFTLKGTIIFGYL